MLTRKPSPKSLAANRANAKLSSGPRSAQGKRLSSLNSLKHGILAAKPVFHSDEQKARFEQIRTLLLADAAPIGFFELLLAEDIANLTWKLILTTDWESQEWDRLIVSGKVLDQVLGKTNLSVELRAELADHWSVMELGVRTTDNSSEAERKADQGAQLIRNGMIRSSENHLKGESKHKTGICTAEVRFARSLDLARRYQASTRADLHRAIRELQTLQATRRDKQRNPPCEAKRGH